MARAPLLAGSADLASIDSETHQISITSRPALDAVRLDHSRNCRCKPIPNGSSTERSSNSNPAWRHSSNSSKPISTDSSSNPRCSRGSTSSTADNKVRNNTRCNSSGGADRKRMRCRCRPGRRDTSARARMANQLDEAWSLLATDVIDHNCVLVSCRTIGDSIITAFAAN
jgi:hypothetical protein